MDQQEAQDLARRYFDQLANLVAHESLAGGDGDRSLAAGYAVQQAFQQLRLDQGAEIAGYKVALTSQAMQEFVGVDQPLAGAVFEDAVHGSPATVELGAHRHLGVEFEIAVQMSADLPGSGESHTRASIAGAVGACIPSFELVDDRNADYSSLNPFDLVAENSWNAGVVLGAPVSGWEAVDLIDGRTRLESNGEVVGEGRTGDALGHPFEAVAFLANHLNGRGDILRAGQFVMTGSSIVTVFPSAGDELTFTIDGLGAVRLSCR